MGTRYSDRRRWAYNGCQVLQVFQSIRAYKRVKKKEKKRKTVALESVRAGLPLPSNLHSNLNALINILRSSLIIDA